MIMTATMTAVVPRKQIISVQVWWEEEAKGSDEKQTNKKQRKRLKECDTKIKESKC